MDAGALQNSVVILYVAQLHNISLSFGEYHTNHSVYTSREPDLHKQSFMPRVCSLGKENDVNTNYWGLEEFLFPRMNNYNFFQFNFKFLEITSISLTGSILQAAFYSAIMSVGSAAIPNAFFASIYLLLKCVNLPTQDIGMLFAVEWLM